jgi:hypothetical protein
MRYRLGELKEAEADHDAALGIRKQLAADFPTRPEFAGSWPQATTTGAIC